MAKRPDHRWCVLEDEERGVLVDLLVQEADGLEHDRRFPPTPAIRAHVTELRALAEKLARIGAPK